MCVSHVQRDGFCSVLFTFCSVVMSITADSKMSVQMTTTTLIVSAVFGSFNTAWSARAPENCDPLVCIAQQSTPSHCEGGLGGFDDWMTHILAQMMTCMHSHSIVTQLSVPWLLPLASWSRMETFGSHTCHSVHVDTLEPRQTDRHTHTHKHTQ